MSNQLPLPVARVVVTGGAGYIGSWVTRWLLGAGYAVTVFDNFTFGSKSLLSILGHPHLKVVQGDVRDAGAVEQAVRGADHVVHLAAIVGEAACDQAPDASVAINVTGTQHVARAAATHGVKRLLVFSTCSSYGVQDTNQMATEETPVNPVSLYARTKLDAEQFLREEMRGLVWTVLRPSTVHGASARMRFDLIVNHLVKDAFLTKKISIFGPQMWRPLMWVGDAGRAIELTLKADESVIRHQVFNVGATDANYRKGEIGEIIKRRWPDLELEFTGKDKDLRSYRVDFSKIETQLGFRLSKSLDEAVEELHQMLVQGMVADPQLKEYANA